MKKLILRSLALASIFGLGYVVGTLNVSKANAKGKPVIEKPAYLIVSGVIKNPDQMKPYVDKALPLAQAAGMKMLGQGESGTSVQLLEGKWPYSGSVLVEKYNSMDALLKFWNSPAYQEAKKLREGVVDVNFIIAVESVE